MSFIPSLSAQQQIDYTSVDYDSLLISAKNRIPALTPEWTDTSDSDLGIVLLQLFCGIGDMLKAYQDRTMNEGYISTAKTRDSMAALTTLIGYQMSNASSATTQIQLTLQLDPVLISSVRVPQASALSIQGVDGKFIFFEVAADTTTSLPVNTTLLTVTDTQHFKVSSPTNISPGKSYYLGGVNKLSVLVQTIDGAGNILTAAPTPTLPSVGDQFASLAGPYQSVPITAYEGRTIYSEQLGYSDSFPNLIFPLSNPNVLDDNANGNFAAAGDPNQIVLFINEGPGAVTWTEVLDFSLSGSADNVYCTRVDQQGYTQVYFGDNKNGRVPSQGAQISATYRVGGGSRGNIGSGSTLLLINPITGVTSATTLSGGTGGADAETLDHARAAAPALLSTLKRGVTAQDIATLCAQADSSVIAAQVVVLDWNTARVSILTNTMTVASPTIAAGTQTNIINYVAPKMMTTQTLTLVAVTLLPIYAALSVQVLNGYYGSTVVASVQQALLSYFQLGQLQIGQRIDLSRIESICQSVPGVDYVDFTNLTISSIGNTIGDIAVPNGSVAILPLANVTLTYSGGS